MVNYLDDKKLKRDLEIALKLEKIERDNRKERKQARMNDLTFQEANAVAFKPITEAVMSLAEAVKPQPRSKEAMLAIEGPPPREAIGANELEVDEQVDKTFESMNRALTESSSRSIYGLKVEGRSAFINSVPAKFEEGNIEVRDKAYELTPGLAFMLASDEKPLNDGLISYHDVYNFLDIMSRVERRVSHSSNKYKKQVSRYFKLENGQWMPTELAKTEYTGKGIKFLPSNTLSLRDMLGLRLAAYKAGNKGLRNEIIAISDELLRQKAIKKCDYKKIVTTVNLT